MTDFNINFILLDEEGREINLSKKFKDDLPDFMRNDFTYFTAEILILDSDTK